MTALWTSADAAAATLGHASRAFTARGLSIDTRTLKPGDLFIALKGDNRDGHAFVRAAMEAKAAAALVTHRPEDVADDAALLEVAHTQRGLEDLARAARARTHARIVAVTGSAGKTTTKEILRLAFGALGITHASAASYNNHWGVPLSLAAMPLDSQFGIFEVGMNHFGELRNLVSFVRPHVALVTTIAPAHLEFFGTLEAIADAKSEIFEGLLPGGTALIPADSPYAERLRARAHQAGVGRILSFGESKGSDARLLSFGDTPDGVGLKADIMGRIVETHLGSAGGHIARNAVGALAAVAAMDGDVLNAAAALRKFAALKGRGARFDASGVDVIDESYNANPASMAAALAVLGSTDPKHGGRRIAVLGDMLEMGPEAPSHHAGLVTPLESARTDLVFAAGANMQALWDVLPASRRGAYAANSAELAPKVMAALRKGDVVLVKGSNGSKLSVVIDALKARSAG
jgi:UDP-N-acetylmuramoyl-tripeptide--D-alanyl-D-alanine ligase